ncbi:MAG: ElyC/SanA/YdcF family protein [Candidatus Gracilibacteria bacterium]
MKKIIIYSGLFLSLVVIFIVAVNFYVLNFSKTHYYYDVDGLDEKYIGLVFGASVLRNGTPSDILKDRLKVAFEAYNKHKIAKIIVSGDNSKSSYNEPVAMQKYLLKLGVEIDDIYLDYAGFDTYDSLYRAREIFGAQELVLFTQDFHLKRAMYISSKLGIDSYGVETNLQKYLASDYYNIREIFARLKAFIEVEILKASPRFLGEKIEIITDEKIEDAKKEILINKG